MNDFSEVVVILLAIVLVVLAVVFVVPFPFFLIGWGVLVIPEYAGWLTVDGYFANAAAGFGLVMSIVLVRALIGKD